LTATSSKGLSSKHSRAVSGSVAVLEVKEAECQAAPLDFVFADGIESGDFSLWSVASP